MKTSLRLIFQTPVFIAQSTALLLLLSCATPAFCGEIHEAVKIGDLAKVKALLKTNPELVNAKDDLNRTALHVAVFARSPETMELLLANKSDIDAQDKKGMTPLHYAAKNNHKECVLVLLAHNANLSVKDTEGRTPADWAASFDFKDITNALVDKGADISIGRALRAGRLDRVESLLKANPALVNTGVPNTTLLHFAVFLNDKSAVNLLLRYKAEVNAKAKDDGETTPLHLAMGCASKEIVELLLANKADVNAKDKDGNTPLNLALGLGRKDVADLLRVHGAKE